MRQWPERFMIILAVAASSATEAGAEIKVYNLPEESAALRPGPGLETVQKNCLACHSADYVGTQPRGLGRNFWGPELTKMRKAYGAPLADEDARVILDYLSGAY